MEKQRHHIFERLFNGEAVPFNDKDYYQIGIACNLTKKMLVVLNAETEPEAIRNLIGKITNSKIDATTNIFTPFQINYGKNTKIGKNVFINFDCVFLDLGGITLEDNVMLAPKVSLLSEGHPISANDRQTLTTGKIHIKKNAWIGANATILAGVTIGENAVVAAGAVVSKDVADNTIVGGVPAKFIKTINLLKPMKNNFKIALPLIICVVAMACNNQNKETMKNTKQELEAIFPKSEIGSKDFFTGNAYPTALVDSDSIYNTLVGNVYFEPGARSNWHSHPAGQILIITDGVGYHQIEGKPIEIIKKGSVVKCPPNVRHWHGASADVGLQQLYIIPNTEKGIVNWNEAVTDEQYLINKN